jgi:hypothetical protein
VFYQGRSDAVAVEKKVPRAPEVGVDGPASLFLPAQLSSARAADEIANTASRDARVPHKFMIHTDRAQWTRGTAFVVVEVD